MNCFRPIERLECTKLGIELNSQWVTSLHIYYINKIYLIGQHDINTIIRSALYSTLLSTLPPL